MRGKGIRATSVRDAINDAIKDARRKDATTLKAIEVFIEMLADGSIEGTLHPLDAIEFRISDITPEGRRRLDALSKDS